MKHVTLETWEDTNGTLGFILAGTPKNETTYAAVSGQLIAHDLLEHQNGLKAIGCPRDELQALGGVWQVRGRWGEIGGIFRTPIEALAYDIVGVATDVFEWTPQSLKTHRHVHDEDFDEILDKARPLLRDEMEHHEFPIDAFLEEARHHLRIGFRKAERRFGDRFTGLNLFGAVNRAVERAARNIEFPGQRFCLSYGNGQATCQETYA